MHPSLYTYFKKKSGGIILPDFRLFYKAPEIKTVWYWHKNRCVDQCSQLESSEINPCTYGQLIYDKGSKNIQWNKDSLFNGWHYENKAATCRTMSLEHFLTKHKK